VEYVVERHLSEIEKSISGIDAKLTSRKIDIDPDGVSDSLSP